MSKSNSSTLLIDEQPLQVLPSLACHLGINAAILLQQINYWIKRAEREKDQRKFKAGRWWTYNSYAQWQEQMPWLSESGIRKLVKKLEDEGLIKTVKHNKGKTDHTKWYSINYDALDTLGHIEPPPRDTSNRPAGSHLEASRRDTSITESPESHSENNAKAGGSEPPAPEEKVEGWEYAEMMRHALKGATVPFTRSRERRYVREFNEAMRKGITPTECDEAMDRIVSEWDRVQLTVEKALRDVQNGKQTNGVRPESVRPESATDPALVDYVFANTRNGSIRSREAELRLAMARHDFASGSAPPWPVEKMLGGTENERWSVLTSLQTLCRRAQRNSEVA